MGRFRNTLGRVRVAAPCEADWDEMRGDERVRFCARCSLNVYNLSAMTRREAESLVVRSQGRLCVRFYQRKDGTIITQNCPVGLSALKRRVSRVGSAAFAAVVSFLAGVGVTPSPPPSETPTARVSAPAPPPETQEEYVAMAGGMGTSPEAALLGCGMLAGVLFAVGYPLKKLKEKQEQKRREELHIWRR